MFKNKNIRKLLNRSPIESLLFLAVLLIGVIFLAYVPPFQKPDENAHYIRVAALAHGGFICQRDAQGGRYFEIPATYYNFPRVFDTDNVQHNYAAKIPRASYTLNYDDYSDLFPGYAKDTRWCSLPFLGYIPNVVGFLAGNTLTTNLLVSFYFTRAAAFIFFIISLVYALYLTPKKFRIAIWVVCLLPITLQQVTAISYDGVLISYAILIYALLVRMLTQPLNNHKYFYYYVAFIWLAMLSKPGYYFFYVLYFLIPYQRIFKSRKNYWLFTIITTFLIFASVYVYSVVLKADEYSFTNAQPTAQQLLIKTDPIFFMGVITKTLETQSEFYLRSSVGYLGWLDYQLTYPILLIGIFMLIYAPYKLAVSTKSVLRWRDILILLIFISGTYMIVSVAMYIMASTFAQPFITGVQGRYLLVLVPFAILLCAQVAQKLTLQRTKLIIIFGLILFTTVNIVYNIYMRYYDYSLIRTSAQSTSLSELYKLTVSPTYLNLDRQIEIKIANPKLAIINGMQLVLQKQTRTSANYAYYILDQSCNKNLYTGYFTLTQIAQDSFVTIDFTKGINAPEVVCMRMKPFGDSVADAKIMVKQKKPLVGLLGN